MKKLTQILDKILEAVLCIMIVFMVFGCGSLPNFV